MDTMFTFIRFLLLFALLLGGLVVPGIATASPGHGNPFQGVRLLVDDKSAAWKQVEAWRASRPAAARQIEKIAREPRPTWFGDWTRDPAQSVGWWRQHKWEPTGTAAYLVVYDLPKRDCSGHYSAGGARNAEAYRNFVRGIARGLG